MSKITNTETEPVTLEKILMMSGGIEAQEAAGQNELVRSEQLPVEIMQIGADELYGENREIYARMGIEVACASAGDDLFFDVRLPANWRIEATEHSMWSELLDNFGRRRGSIFYKAAFYDRKAHFVVQNRFGVECYESSDKDGNFVQYGSKENTHLVTYITDCGKFLHLIGVRDWQRGINASEPDQRTMAEQWLNENYPDWKNPFAYWNS